jgi:gluconokinase
MRLVVCMGVSGVGKSSVGRALAERLGGFFVDADDFHPASNRQKMAQGIPLEDADRWGWLDALNQEVKRIAAHAGPDQRVFLACSALKQSYRERLCRGLAADAVTFVFLRAPFAIIRDRLEKRTGHFMPATLLASQFAALEEPPPDRTLVVDACLPLAELVEQVARALREQTG